MARRPDRIPVIEATATVADDVARPSPHDRGPPGDPSPPPPSGAAARWAGRTAGAASASGRTGGGQAPTRSRGPGQSGPSARPVGSPARITLLRRARPAARRPPGPESPSTAERAEAGARRPRRPGPWPTGCGTARSPPPRSTRCSPSAGMAEVADGVAFVPSFANVSAVSTDDGLDPGGHRERLHGRRASTETLRDLVPRSPAHRRLLPRPHRPRLRRAGVGGGVGRGRLARTGGRGPRGPARPGSTATS